MKARRIELDAHCTKVCRHFVKLRAGGDLGDRTETFRSFLCRSTDAGKFLPGVTGGLGGCVKSGTCFLPGVTDTGKPLCGDPGGLRRTAEVRLDLLQGSVDGGKVAGRFLRAVRAYFNAYRRCAACHCLPLFLLCLSVSLA